MKLSITSSLQSVVSLLTAGAAHLQQLCRAIVLMILTLSAAMQAHARETIVQLDDGSSIKVFLFEPENHGDGPWPLAVLMSGGTGNEYVARSQFWLGRELALHGWMIAVPVSPTNTPFTGENGRKLPTVIQRLQEHENIVAGKVLLVGVSTGGSSALELAAQNPDQYYGVIAVPGMLKNRSLIGDMRGLPVYLRIGEDDAFRWNRELPGLVTALEAGGARVNARLIPRGKHIFRLDWAELEPWIESVRTASSSLPEE
jgi:dienelactone hydrolase